MKTNFLYHIRLNVLLTFIAFLSISNQNMLSAQPKFHRPVTRVLIIGISDYKNIKNLEYADNDADKMYAYFERLNQSTSDSIEIILLKNQDTGRMDIWSDCRINHTE